MSFCNKTVEAVFETRPSVRSSARQGASFGSQTFRFVTPTRIALISTHARTARSRTGIGPGQHHPRLFGSLWVTAIGATGPVSGIDVRVASPRILKPGESRIVNFLLSLDCPILVRAGGILHDLNGRDHPPLIGDFSLNAANALTAQTLLDLGLTRITPSHDLNADQISSLAGQIGPEAIEVIAYQHLPVFHTEHCVFCRFLSTGTSFRDCGRPCEQHRVALKDQHQRAHPVMADVGCRNTVFGAEAQEASGHLHSWREAGVRYFRLEFVHETAEQVVQVTRAFSSALRGSTNYVDLARQLKRISPGGVTEGSLFVPSNYLTLPILQ